MTTPNTTGQATPAQYRDLTAADVGTVVTRHGIRTVEPIIRPYLRHTPAITVDRADFGLPPGPLVLKLELLQHAGSFKARGAFANLLLRDMPAAGVVAASGGNHGAAVAFAARALGIPARIYVPHVSSPAKIARIRSYGADLVVTGDTYSDALAASQEWTATSGALAIHAYDQAETMLGAGSLGMELAEQAPDATQVLASVGGGGLLAGVAAWYAGRAQVVGVEPEGAPTLTAAMRAGRPVDAETGSVAVDSLAPRQVGELTFAIIRQQRGAGAAGGRRRHPPDPATALGDAAGGGRAWRVHGPGRPGVRALRARAGRDGRRGDQRREHDRGRLRPTPATPPASATRGSPPGPAGQGPRDEVTGPRPRGVPGVLPRASARMGGAVTPRPVP